MSPFPTIITIGNLYSPTKIEIWNVLSRHSLSCRALQWRHNEGRGVSNHRGLDCLLNHLFRRRSKKTPKLRVTGLCKGNSPVTGEFPTQRASNAENVSIWWRHQMWPCILTDIYMYSCLEPGSQYTTTITILVSYSSSEQGSACVNSALYAISCCIVSWQFETP